MSTRSRIGIVEKDGRVKSVYVHSDGYPSYEGNMLLDNYKTERKVRMLVNLGALSIVDKRVTPSSKHGRTRDYDRPIENGGFHLKPAHGRHTLQERQCGVTLAYHRDCGEPLEFRIDESVDAFRKSDVDCWGYLFDGGKWFVVDGCSNSRRLVPLTKRYCETHD